MAILIPEIIIYKSLKSFFEVCKLDYKNKIDKTETYLYRIFGKDENGNDLIFENVKIFEQAVDLLTENPTAQRQLQINLGFNLERVELPTLHLMLPDEQPGNVAIGSDEGYAESVLTKTSQTLVKTYTARNHVAFNILLTSKNYLEIIIIYNFLKSIIISLQKHLELNNLQNVAIGGSDVMFDDSILPPYVFSRNFNMKFTYDYTVPDLNEEGIISQIYVTKNFISQL